MELISTGVLFLLALSVLITDAWKKKIYNFQTLPAVIIGFILGWLQNGGVGLLHSFYGFAVGLLLLLFFYWLGGVGAGDVKYLAAIGALKGVSFVLVTMFYTAFAGGIMAFAIIIWKGRVRETFSNIYQLLKHPLTPIAPNDEFLYLPYGVAISCGTLITLLMV